LRLCAFAVRKYKIPISVLVLIHTPDLQVLLLERADHPGFWQSVTGSQDEGETLRQTAAREVAEETGLDAEAFGLIDWNIRNEYEIYLEWRWRYAPGVTRNVEHVFGLRLPEPLPVKVAPGEHLGYVWMPHDRAADKVFSWSNAQVLRTLPEHLSNRLQQ
jgi:dATP pyrophosphohydrolase